MAPSYSVLVPKLICEISWMRGPGWPIGDVSACLARGSLRALPMGQRNVSNYIFCTVQSGWPQRRLSNVAILSIYYASSQCPPPPRSLPPAMELQRLRAKLKDSPGTSVHCRPCADCQTTASFLIRTASTILRSTRRMLRISRIDSEVMKSKGPCPAGCCSSHSKKTLCCRAHSPF